MRLSGAIKVEFVMRQKTSRNDDDDDDDVAHNSPGWLDEMFWRCDVFPDYQMFDCHFFSGQISCLKIKPTPGE